MALTLQAFAMTLLTGVVVFLLWLMVEELVLVLMTIWKVLR